MDERVIYRVGLTYNVKTSSNVVNEDDEAELDDLETVTKIKNAIQEVGCEVVLLEATGQLVDKLKENNIDIVFNFAEGLKGRGREAQVPALLNLLNIPFTGSDETTLGVGLDKALTKRIVSSERIKTPKFQLFKSPNEKLIKKLKFPVIVKPNAEGSSKGIADISVAVNEEEMYMLIKRLFNNYNCNALVEEYIKGREFTVGILGNGDDLNVLSPMEIMFKDKKGLDFYSYRIKKDSETTIYCQCPAKIDKSLEKKIKTMAIKVYKILECKDVARIDLRVSEDNIPYFIEINPLPGLIDDFSDLVVIAKSCGMPYNEIILSILNNALLRNNMKPITLS